MQKVSQHSLGMALGVFMAVFHALWSVMILIGVAQWFMDFIFKLHMIAPPYTISSFSFGSAIALIVVTGVIGYIMGWVLGWAWNRYAVR